MLRNRTGTCAWNNHHNEKMAVLIAAYRDKIERQRQRDRQIETEDAMAEPALADENGE